MNFASSICVIYPGTVAESGIWRAECIVYNAGRIYMGARRSEQVYPSVAEALDEAHRMRFQLYAELTTAIDGAIKAALS